VIQINSQIIIRPCLILNPIATQNRHLKVFEGSKNLQDVIRINIKDAYVLLKIIMKQQLFLDLPSFVYK